MSTSGLAGGRGHCPVCSGIREVKCPACEGKAAYARANSGNGSTSKSDEIKEYKREYTTARQVQAILYLLEKAGMPDIEKTEIARFIEFLTGKNYHNIYEKVRSPLKSRDRADTTDLVYLKDQFTRVGLTELVRIIENAINMKSD